MRRRLPAKAGLLALALSCVPGLASAQTNFVTCQFPSASVTYKIEPQSWSQWDERSRSWIPRRCDVNGSAPDGQRKASCQVIINDFEYSWISQAEENLYPLVKFWSQYHSRLTVNRQTGAGRYLFETRDLAANGQYVTDVDIAAKCSKAVDPATIPPPAPKL